MYTLILFYTEEGKINEKTGENHTQFAIDINFYSEFNLNIFISISHLEKLNFLFSDRRTNKQTLSVGIVAIQSNDKWNE